MGQKNFGVLKSINTFTRIRQDSIQKLHKQLSEENSGIKIFMNKKERTMSMPSKRGLRNQNIITENSKDSNDQFANLRLATDM